MKEGANGTLEKLFKRASVCEDRAFCISHLITMCALYKKSSPCLVWLKVSSLPIFATEGYSLLQLKTWETKAWNKYLTVLDVTGCIPLMWRWIDGDMDLAEKVSHFADGS